jgi:outer membrane receptor for ferrienterochelin and colicins
MRFVTAIFVSLACSSSAAAQTRAPRIAGTVSDTRGQPIAFARVYVRGGQDTVTTDPKGRFEFDSLAANIVSLTAEFIGYIPSQRDTVLSRSGKTTWIEFRLRDSPLSNGYDFIQAVPDSK